MANHGAAPAPGSWGAWEGGPCGGSPPALSRRGKAACPPPVSARPRCPAARSRGHVPRTFRPAAVPLVSVLYKTLDPPRVGGSTPPGRPLRTAAAVMIGYHTTPKGKSTAFFASCLPGRVFPRFCRKKKPCVLPVWPVRGKNKPPPGVSAPSRRRFSYVMA